jgi:putative phosphoribosyl transferase
VDRSITISDGYRSLIGDLVIPPGASGVVVFAHGSGSGRKSPRNQFVAQTLQHVGLATLLLDLLEEREAQARENVFDIDLLTDRLLAASRWLGEQKETVGLPLGYFGASTGAGAALKAAAREPELVAAVVSRGGRPDLAAEELPRVRAPTLLIVGGNDDVVLGLNETSLALLRCEKAMQVIPHATHLFPEPGALEGVADLAARWFVLHLPTSKKSNYG